MKSDSPKKPKKSHPWLRALTNPHLLFCLAAAWFLTNGWSYCALGIGVFFSIDWLRNLASVYLGLLWVPGTPEKILTIALAIFLLRRWFPDDERTLSLLKHKSRELIEKTKFEWQSFRSWLKRNRKSKDD